MNFALLPRNSSWLENLANYVICNWKIFLNYIFWHLFLSNSMTVWKFFREMEEYSREPCPWRIVDDCGGAFAMGCIGGGVFQAIKGFRNAPSGMNRRFVSLLFMWLLRKWQYFVFSWDLFLPSKPDPQSSLEISLFGVVCSVPLTVP